LYSSRSRFNLARQWIVGLVKLPILVLEAWLKLFDMYHACSLYCKSSHIIKLCVDELRLVTLKYCIVKLYTLNCCIYLKRNHKKFINSYSLLAAFPLIKNNCLAPKRSGRVTTFIIYMTKLLQSDWLRGVQLFH
jgi:hypothetical protein